MVIRCIKISITSYWETMIFAYIILTLDREACSVCALSFVP